MNLTGNKAINADVTGSTARRDAVQIISACPWRQDIVHSPLLSEKAVYILPRLF
jgi:hypothetical protein